MGKYYIGFDCGTQSVKAAIYDEDFKILGIEQISIPIDYPECEWAQMDANDYLNNVRECIKRCVEKTNIDPHEVRSICGDGIICGVVGVDQNGEAITPYIPYLDNRGKEDAEWINEHCEPYWLKESGNCEVRAFFPVIFMRWLLKNNRNFQKDGVKFVHNGPYVLGRLAGLKGKDMFIDYVTMSGSLVGYDVIKKEWSENQMNVLDIPMKYLPKVVSPTDIVGQLTKKEAEKMGLVAGIPIVAGAGDTMQSLLGAGLTEVGMVSDVAGTSAMIAVVVDQMNEKLNANPDLYLSIGSLGDTYFYWGSVITGGLSLRWFKENVAGRMDGNHFYDEINEGIESTPAGSNGVVYLPYLQGSCGLLKNSSGCFLNMSMATKQETLYKSVLEAIAYEYKPIMDSVREAGIKTGDIVITEGGSKTKDWNQIKANVLEADTYTLKTKEGAVRSNVLLGAYAVGDIKDLKAKVNGLVEIKNRYKVNQKDSATYQDLYKKRQTLIHKEMLGGFDVLCKMK